MIVFKPSQATVTVSIQIYDDDEVEDDETFKVQLSQPQGCVLGWQSECEVTIIDDDGPGEIFFACAGLDSTLRGTRAHACPTS
eukprot:3524574-Prymnesium_polylepis.1